LLVIDGRANRPGNAQECRFRDGARGGVFGLIREPFAQVPEARAHDYEPGRFSFNLGRSLAAAEKRRYIGAHAPMARALLAAPII
jgi:hypothetical protein